MDYTSIIVALVAGGAAFKFLEKVFELWFGSGKSLRDELRGEIARLEGIIKGLEGKVDHLEGEVDSWKSKVDEWRHKYYSLLEKYTRAKTELAFLKGEPITDEEE